MKTLQIITNLLLSTLLYSQDPFLGTWEWQEGNQIFRVIIEINPENSSEVYGNYQMINIINGQEQIVFRSDKLIDPTESFRWPFVFSGNIGENTHWQGWIFDNTMNIQGVQFLHCFLDFEILNPNTGSNQASWKVKIDTDAERKYTSEDISVPRDIILTKVE